MRIPDFTKKEINYLIEWCNFTKQERELFLLRNAEHPLEECAEIMGVSVSTVNRLNKRLKAKIIKVL